MIVPHASLKSIDSIYEMLIDFRNNVIYKYSSYNNNNDGVLNHRNALYFKFNIKILCLLQDFTEFIFKKIDALYKKFE